ncbi:hypothetical protein [Aquimarina sp. SS2-1]|uniref:hypothetical protein n=1 Tax=Aquimarina besae TaxID=3342247 RepID=UPI00366A9717
MKQIRIYITTAIASVLLLFASCQQEEREVIDPTLDNTIPKNSELAVLMKNIVTHDGSYDDIVDKGHCYSINLPYVILRNGIDPIIISQIEDYDQLQQSDNIQIQFPVIVTRDDHTEEFIANDEELQSLASSCQIQDDDIECIDFVYPITFSTFNSNNNNIGTVEVLHDAQVFSFMENLNENTVVAIKYPINLRLSDGEFVSAGHNEELVSRILAFETSCDENDG